jgi:AcrR family transcriptional regulator
MGRSARTAGVRHSEKAARSDAAETRLALICAAERLFSEQGLQRTSLRQINQEAGQRNESAVHYHFGSREAVIAAILDLRTKPVNEARLLMLEDARAAAEGAPLSSQALAEIFVLPLAQAIAAAPGGNHYVRFLTQLYLDHVNWKQFSGGAHDTALVQCLAELARSKPYLPRPVLNQRFVAATGMLNQMLTIVEAVMQARPPHEAAREANVRVANIIDLVVGILDAPVSPRTLSALTATEER